MREKILFVFFFAMIFAIGMLSVSGAVLPVFPSTDSVVTSVDFFSNYSLNATVGQSLGIGDIRAIDQYGNLMPVPQKNFTVTSSNNSVFTVYPTVNSQDSWVIKAVSAGDAIVNASYEGISATRAVHVQNKPSCINSINTSLSSSTIIIGNTAQLDVTAIDQYGGVVNNPTIYWMNSNPGVASIDVTSRVVTGTTPGQVSFTPFGNGCFGAVYGPGVSITVLPIPGTFGIVSSTGVGGNITPHGYLSVLENDSQIYNIIPNANYRVTDVLVDGISIGAINNYTFTNVTSAHTISATFALNRYNITSSTGNYGSISPSGNFTVNSGSSFAYTITPSAKYHIADVLVDGISIGNVTSYQFTNITANHAISASFVSTCQTTADTNNDGVVGLSEILFYINQWKVGNVTNSNILAAVGFWKKGTGC